MPYIKASEWKKIQTELAELRAEVEALRSVDLEEVRKPSESSHAIDLNDDNFQSVIGNPAIPVVVKFGADWCGPCRRIDPVLDEIAAEDTGYDVGKVNVDHSPRVTSQYGIRSLPTMVVFRDGQEIGRFVGGMPKPYLMDAISEVL